jgi:hypothetical protein
MSLLNFIKSTNCFESYLWDTQTDKQNGDDNILEYSAL